MRMKPGKIRLYSNGTIIDVISDVLSTADSTYSNVATIFIGDLDAFTLDLLCVAANLRWAHAIANGQRGQEQKSVSLH